MPDDKWAQYAQPVADKWEQYAQQAEAQPQGQRQGPADEYGSSGFEHYEAPPISQLAAGAAKSVPGLTGGLTGFEQYSPEELKTGMQQATTPQNEAQTAGHMIGTVAQMLPWGAGAQKAAGAAEKAVLNRVSPSAIKQGAGQVYKALESDVGSLPIDMKRSGPLLDKIASRSEWESWPQGLKKIFNRATDPDKPGLTYSDANGVISELGSRAEAASRRGLSNTARKYGEVKQAILEDTQDALQQVGRDAEYAKARGDWARAKQLEATYNALKKWAIPAAVGAAGAKAYYTLSDLLGK